MSLEIVIVLGVTLGAIVLFATERLSVDLVALVVLGVLLATRIVSAEEAIAGFSNAATVTVAAMFVISAALFQSGAVNGVGTAISRLAVRSPRLALASLMIGVGTISGFINNTAAVAILLPIVMGVAKTTGISASKLLIPLSFASMFGGVCTLIGTSTNILVSSIAEDHGLPAFGMFEFLPLGLVFFATGVAYMLSVGVRLIPDRRAAGDLEADFAMRDYLTEVVLLDGADSVGKSLAEAPLVRELDLGVRALYRGGRLVPLPTGETVLEAGDTLHVRCSVDAIRRIQSRAGVALKATSGSEREVEASPETLLVEAVVAPNSDLVGRSLKEVGFRSRYRAMALAMRHQGRLLHSKLGTTRLLAGDALLVEVRRDRLEQLEHNPDFVIVSEVGTAEFRTTKILPALAIVAGVAVVATLGILPIVGSAIIGALLMVLAGCITAEEAYRSIQWRVIFLLAGVLTLGVALEKTGAAMLVASALLSFLGTWGPSAVVCALFLASSSLTNLMSNNATAALLAPIAIVAADSMGVEPRAFLMAITFAASLSFMTPVGYQTNTMIYEAGRYRFADFLRVGAPLNLLFWIIGSLLIPRLWPF